MALGNDTTNVQGIGAVMPKVVAEDVLCDQLLRLREVVLAGHHPIFKLSQAVIDQLQASAAFPPAPKAHELPKAQSNGMLPSSVTTNYNLSDSLESRLPGLSESSNSTLSQSQREGNVGARPNVASAPGLNASAGDGHGLTNANAKQLVPLGQPAGLGSAQTQGYSATLDPIFLEKAPSLVRAEGQLKRQRIERDLQLHADRYKQTAREREHNDAGPAFDVQDVLAQVFIIEPHVSGLKPQPTAPSPATSFDENDYYSSQVESDWSPHAHSVKDSDLVAGYPAQMTNGAAVLASATIKQAHPSNSRDPKQASHQLQEQAKNDDTGYEDEDEYTPPDIPGFGGREGQNLGLDAMQMSSADDASDYEPGEIVSGADALPLHSQGHAQASPQVPIIRNHLTHIAAPQPNRVSPLAVAKGSNYELELIDGRPELVHKGNTSQPQNSGPSRQSSASPSANGYTGNSKKRRRQKRKRESDMMGGRGRKKRDRKAGGHSPPSPDDQEPYIKDEPFSPPPMANVPEMRHQAPESRSRSNHVDLVSPKQTSRYYTAPSNQSAPRFEYAAPASPAVFKVASPAYRTVQRDTTDLRRIASLHNAQRPLSPVNRHYSPSAPPAQYRAASTVYGDQVVLQQPSTPVDPRPLRYDGHHASDEVRYIRAEPLRSPLRLKEYHDDNEHVYRVRVESPALMPPPQAPIPPRRIVVDQHGNRYYAAESTHPPPPLSRGSAMPFADRSSLAEIDRHRSSTRYPIEYQEAPAFYTSSDAHMAPVYRHQPVDDRPIRYINTEPNGTMREYSVLPVEQQQVRYIEAPHNAYEPTPLRYERMAPPPPIHTPLPDHQSRTDQSPTTQYASRSYSVHPDTSRPATTMLHQQGYPPRQTSVAPVQYIRQHAPSVAPLQGSSLRPVSAMPPPQPPQGYASQQQQQYARSYSYAPAQGLPGVPPQQQHQQIRYVDQSGQEILATDQGFRQMSEFRYQ